MIDHRLYSPADRFAVELVVSASRTGIITSKQLAEYLAVAVRAGYCSRSVYEAAKEHGKSVLPEIARNKIFLNRCLVQGLGYEDFQIISALEDGAFADRISIRLRSMLIDEFGSVNANTILCAEKTGEISRRKSDALLKAHFYHLLEQLTHASAIPANVHAGWRMRSQQLEVERAQYEYKADKFMNEAKKASSPDGPPR